MIIYIVPSDFRWWFFFISVYELVSPASKTLMIAGVWSMSRETLSNQPFSIRKVKTFRRLFRALWVSALSLLASSGWYLVLNLGSKFVPERGGQGMGRMGSKGLTCIIQILPHVIGKWLKRFTERHYQKYILDTLDVVRICKSGINY